MVTDDDIERYARDGVVCLKGAIGSEWISELREGIEVDYVRRLVRARRLAPPQALPGSPRWPWPLQVRTLGPFEVLLDDEPLELKAQRRPMALR